MRKTRLGITYLERRDVPAQFGVPWTDNHVSLSFAPDGTMVDGVASNLFQTLGSNNSWKTEILRAVQTWAAEASLDVNIVPDSGWAAGAFGSQQHDPRFGDIRVFGRPLSSDVLAITVPPGPATGTRAGDIIINTNYAFKVGGGEGLFDLYTCMLQETGHALGIPNSTITDSVMFPWYQGVRTGLHTTDAAKIATLYGNRVEDAYDTASDNGGFGSTTLLSVGTNPEIRIEAEISAAYDADYYLFTVPEASDGTITISLRTSFESLLQGRLTIYSTDLTKIWQSAEYSPLDGDMTAALANVTAGTSYYICVDRALGLNEFGVGDYVLQIDFSPMGPPTPVISNESIVDDAGGNETLATADELQAVEGRPGFYSINAKFSGQDLDTYQLSVPAGSSSNLVLTAAIRSGTAGMTPLISLFDDSASPLAFETTHSTDGNLVVQASVMPGQRYYLVATPDVYGSTTIGNYRLDANLNTAATRLEEFTSGELTDAEPFLGETIVVNRATVMHFTLSPQAINPSNSFGAQCEITDDNGDLVYRFGTPSYKSATGSHYLAPGTYTIRVGGKVRTLGTPLPTFSVALNAFDLSDPIGPIIGSPDLPDPWWRGERPAAWNPWDIDLDIIF